MTAPIKTCDYCSAVGVMPTFMDGETVCYDCLPTLPKTLGEAWREIVLLRTKIEQMEKQEPIGKFIQHPSNGIWEQDVYGDDPEARPLYLGPGAQPTPSVPVDVITDYLVSISVYVAHQDDLKAQAEIRELLRMLAAAPEAK